jgi:hypothetical protein
VSDSHPLSLRETLDVARGLLDGWDTKQPPLEFSPRRDIDHGRFACVYGLAAHAHRLGKAAIALYDADLALEALPTIRCTYEHGLTAMWAAQYPTAARALVNESYRNRRNTIGSAQRAGWAHIVKLAEESDDWGPIASPLDSTAKSLQQLCGSLEPGGEQAYSIFRLMSSMSHPGAHLVDYYIHKDPVAVQATPKELDAPEIWMFMTCCSLLWAGRAVDMIHKEHPRRNELRSIAKRLGISPELRPRYR